MQTVKSTLYFVLSAAFAVAAAFAIPCVVWENADDEHVSALDSSALAVLIDAQIALAR